MIRPVGVLLVLALFTAVPWAATVADADGRASEIDVVVDGDRLSVRARQAPVRDVLTAIAAQMGLALSIQGEEPRTVTIQLERVQLLEALDRIVRGGYALAGDRLLVFLGSGRGSAAPQTEETPPPAAEPQEKAPVATPPGASPPPGSEPPPRDEPAPAAPEPTPESGPQPPRSSP